VSFPPWVLVVAGHDSSGGAGVDADCEAIAELGLDARVVVTADTLQDEHAVHAVRPRAPREWLARATELLDEAPGAVKLGLLPDGAAVRAAGELIARARAASTPVVLDPVLRSSSGHDFLGEAALRELANGPCRAASVITPNLFEAARLLDRPFELLARDVRERAAAANELVRRGARAVVLKGGHGSEDPAIDVLARLGEPALELAHPRVPGASIRGSGCRHASALAAALALGEPLPRAARRAAELVARRLAASGAPHPSEKPG